LRSPGASSTPAGRLSNPILEQGDEGQARRYEEALARGEVVVPFERGAARVYADLRRQPGLRAPDAMQLACAVQARADLFVTNDERLSRVVAPGVQFVTSLDRAPL
jgi:predicted nucleic acid-binding protein